MQWLQTQTLLHTDWVQDLIYQLASHVMLGKLLNLSEPCFLK